MRRIIQVICKRQTKAGHQNMHLDNCCLRQHLVASLSNGKDNNQIN